MADPDDSYEEDSVADRDVRDLLARYCMAVDDGRFEDFEELFTESGSMHVMGATHTGRRAVRSFMESAQPPESRGRHTVSSTVLRLDPTSGEGSGWVDYVFYDRRGAATNIGRYHDRYVRDDDGRWRFALREIVFLGEEPVLTEPWP